MSLTGRPQVSASIVANTFEELQRTNVVEQVLAALPEDSRTRICSLREGDWVELDDHLALYAATLAALGVERSYAIWRETMLLTLKKGIYSKLWSGLGRMLGASPSNFYRHSGRAWSVATRNCGVQTYDGHEGSALIMWDDLPPTMVQSLGFCTSMRAKLEAVLLATRSEGVVKQTVRDFHRGSLHILATWTPNPGPGHDA